MDAQACGVDPELPWAEQPGQCWTTARPRAAGTTYAGKYVDRPEAGTAIGPARPPRRRAGWGAGSSTPRKPAPRGSPGRAVCMSLA